jgi:hypothetical protein
MSLYDFETFKFDENLMYPNFQVIHTIPFSDCRLFLGLRVLHGAGELQRPDPVRLPLLLGLRLHGRHHLSGHLQTRGPTEGESRGRRW